MISEPNLGILSLKEAIARKNALEGNPSAAWTIRRADEMATDIKPAPPELIKGMLYEGGTMMMAGASKSMKSYTMIALGLAVATGSEWLGFKCAKAPVFFLNLELQQFAMEARVREVAAAMKIDPPKDFMTIHLRGQMVGINQIEANLASMLDEYQPGMTIIDPHYKISSASGVEENSNDAQGLLLYRLENLICSRKSSLNISHHFSKGDKSQTKAMDRAAGGGALARWGDVMMSITDHEEEKCTVAEFSLRNFKPIDPFGLRWDYPVWRRDESLDPTKLKKAGRTTSIPATGLLTSLKNGMTHTEWHKASNMVQSTFSRKKKELELAGKVKHVSGLFYHP